MQAIEASPPITVQAWAAEEPLTAQAHPIGPVAEGNLAAERFRVLIENLTPADKTAILKSASLLVGSWLLVTASKVSLFAIKALPWCIFLAKSPLGDSFRKIVPFSFLAFPTIQSTLICLAVCAVTALTCHYLSVQCLGVIFDVYRSNSASLQKMIKYVCEEVIRRYDNYNNVNFERNCQIIGENPVEVLALIADICCLSRFTSSLSPEQREAFSDIHRRFQSECLEIPTERAGAALFEQLTAMRESLLQTP